MKARVVIMTIISGVLFCSIMIAVSIAPFPKTPNEFNSPDMWINTIMTIIFYAIPLRLYIAGVKSMKYVMAILCILGCFLAVLTTILALAVGFFMNSVTAFLGVIILCTAVLIANIVWFIMAFSRQAA